MSTDWDLTFTDTELMDYQSQLEYGRQLISKGEHILLNAQQRFGRIISMKRADQIKLYQKRKEAEEQCKE